MYKLFPNNRIILDHIKGESILKKSILKKSLITLSMIASLTIPTMGVLADNTSHSGSAEVTNNKFKILTVQSVGGGTWNYGFTGTKVYSQYDHNGVTHKASVKNSNANSLTSSGWKARTITAYVAIEATWKGNQAYWNTK